MKILRRLILTLIAFVALEATASEPIKGYRGFVDLNAEAVFKKKYPQSSHDIVYSISSVTTTQGYQFNKHFFAGGGLGLAFGTTNYDWFSCGIAIPVYASGRADWNIGKVPLFADLRLGSYLNSDGFVNWMFINPSIGYRCAVSRKIALNIGVGTSIHCFERFPDSTGKAMLSVKLGIEFH